MFKRFLLIAILLQFSLAAAAGEYCLALRGNGELMPGHWGAISNVVERLGLPVAQAGGSSATITMFLMDAVASNPLIKDANPEIRTLRAALLIKSFQGFVEYLETTKQFRDFRTLYGRVDDFQSTSWIDELRILFKKAEPLALDDLVEYVRVNDQLIRRNVQVGEDLGLIGPDNYRSLYLALHAIFEKPVSFETVADLRKVIFYLGELKHTIKVFGAFDAASDSNLLFRPGIVNFDRLAEQVGRIGQFYSAAEASPETIRLWQGWMGLCAPAAKGKTWETLTGIRRDCRSEFNNLVTAHFRAQPQNLFVQSKTGQAITTFASTAVLKGQAYQQAARLMAEYEFRLEPEFGKDLTFSHTEEIKFGYWGEDEKLKKVSLALSADDEKSRRFLSLGRAPWYQVLRLSPAEPGLANLRPFKVDGEDLFSAGGWPDLHPTAVLRAAGCERVIYVTRRGGDSFFAQGVGKRLLGYDRSWDLLDPKNEALNNNGDPTDQTSLWSRLYNLANPKSSFRQALDQADAVLCTNWSKFNLKLGVAGLIEDGYKSPFFVKSDKQLEQLLNPKLNPQELSSDGTYPEFAGCF